LGYNVVAATGKTNETEYLSGLGAKDIIHRDEVKMIQINLC
jgi:hypothetical protein